MKKILRILWNFASQFSGVVATIVLALAGIGYLLQYVQELKLKGIYLFFPFLFFVVLILFSFKFIKKYLSSSTNQFLSDQEEQTIKENVAKFEQSSSKKDTHLSLPKTNDLKKLRNLSMRKANNWASDADEINMCVSIDVNGGRSTYQSQIYFYSKWKSQELVIFLPRYNTIKREQERSLMNQAPPFFETFINWDKAINKAFEQLEDKLSDRFTIWLYSDPDEFRFRFVVFEKDTSKEYKFNFNGKILKSGNNSIEIK